MNRKFLIISPPRTGSTSYAFQLRHQYCRGVNIRKDGYGSDELFHPEYKNITMPECLHMLSSNPRWVLKIQPLHLITWYAAISTGSYCPPTMPDDVVLDVKLLQFYSELIECCTNHIYLYRRNFVDQVISHVIARETNNYFIERNTTDLIILSDHEIMLSRQEIYNQWQVIKTLYNHKPGKVVAMEDQSDELYIKKYPRYQNVIGNFDLIGDFDIEAEIFGIKKEGHCAPLKLN
jgi:hypothetical protein